MEGRTRLDSWKEISSYLKRSIATCQRWEATLGLPIHRLDGTPSARVFADPAELDDWMAEKLSHPEAKAKESAFTRRQRIRWMATTAGAVILLAASAVRIWQFLMRTPVSFPSGNQTSVAFLPFENVTADESLEAWRTALPQLLGFDIAQSRAVDGYGAVSPAVLIKVGLQEAKTFGPEDLKKIAQQIGVGHLVNGSLIRSGNDLIISLAIHDTRTGELIQSFQKICRGEKGLFPAVDEFTKKIKVALNVPRRLIAHDIDKDVSQIVTGSPAAWKWYCEGLRLDREGKLNEAVTFYRKATEVDPEFSEAFYKSFLANDALFACCGDAGAREEAFRCGKKAFEFSERLGVRSRSDLIRSYYLDFQKNFPMAVAEYKRLLAIMEDDPLTMRQLAQIYWDLEEYDKVIALLENERAKQDSGNIGLLANSYARMGAYDEAERTFHESNLNYSGSGGFDLLYDQEICALAQRKFDHALAYNDRLNSPFPRVVKFVRNSRAPIFIAQDDFPNAENELLRIIEQGPEHEKFEGLCHLTGLYLTQGQLAKARDHAELAIELAKSLSWWPLIKKSHFLKAYLSRLSGNLPEALRESEQSCPCYAEDDSLMKPGTNTKIVSELDDISCLRYFHLRALITLEMGRMAEFEEHLAEIKQLVDRSQYPKLRRAYFHLLGQKELRENDFDSAINYLWKALNMLPSPYGHEHDVDSAQYFDSLAEAYYQAGRYGSALDLYKKMPAYWEQRVSSGGLYARSFFRIAKIYDQSVRPAGASRDQVEADKTLAKQNYRKFLSLWKDADPVFGADIEEASRRLAALEAEVASGAPRPVK